MKKTEAVKVGDVIAQILDGSDNNAEFDKQKVCYLWSEVMGYDVNRATIRRYVEGDTLHVYLSSAVLKSELAFMTDALTDKFNQLVGRPVIKKILLH